MVIKLKVKRKFHISGSYYILHYVCTAFKSSRWYSSSHSNTLKSPSNSLCRTFLYPPSILIISLRPHQLYKYIVTKIHYVSVKLSSTLLVSVNLFFVKKVISTVCYLYSKLPLFFFEAGSSPISRQSPTFTVCFTKCCLEWEIIKFLKGELMIMTNSF